MNFSDRNFVRGVKGSGISKDFLKNSRSIWLSKSSIHPILWLNNYILVIPILTTFLPSVVPSTLPFKMFGPFGSVWCKTALAEVGLSLP